MAKKKDTESAKKKNTSLKTKITADNKKQPKKRSSVVSLKPSHPCARKTNNYRDFLRCLFSGSNNNDDDFELLDES